VQVVADTRASQAKRASNRADAESLLMQLPHFLEDGFALCSAELALGHDLRIGRMKPFLAGSIALERSTLALSVEYRLFLGTRWSHDVHQGLCFLRRVCWWLLSEVISQFCCFFGETAPFVQKLGHDRFTQVRQEMPAIGYLLCVRSAFFDRLRGVAGGLRGAPVRARG